MTEETQRPDEPTGQAAVWYRGWECDYEPDRANWTGEGYTAYLGGCDLDARQVSAPTWERLLEEIDDQEDE